MVVRQPNQKISVYKLQPENGSGPRWTVHCNMLRPCVFMAYLPETVNAKEVQPDPSESTDEEWWLYPPYCSCGAGATREL